MDKHPKATTADLLANKKPLPTALLTVIQTADGKIEITMYPEDKRYVKAMVVNAFADKGFKEVIFEAVVVETQTIMEQMGIEPEGQELTPPPDLFYPKRH